MHRRIVGISCALAFGPQEAQRRLASLGGRFPPDGGVAVGTGSAGAWGTLSRVWGGNFSVVVWGAKRMSGDIVGLRRGCGVLGRRPAKSVERLSRGSSGSRAAGRSSLFCPGRQGSGAGCGRQSTTAAVDGVFSGCQERGESHGEAVSGVWIRVGVASVRCGAVTRGVRARRLSVSVGM